MERSIDQALQRAVAAHKEGRLPEAEQLYFAILRAAPDHPDANHNLGLLFITRGNLQEAITRFRNALKANTDVGQFWISYVECLIAAGKFADATVALSDARHAGIPAEQLMSLEQTLQSASHSSNLPNAGYGDAGDLEARGPSQKEIELLFEYYQSEQLEYFEKLAITMTKEYPNHPIGWKALGAALKRTGRVAESLEPLKRSINLLPQDVESQSNLGSSLRELGRLDEAEGVLREALRVNPEYAEAHYHLGNTLQELGRLPEAEISFRKATVLQPDHVKAHNNLGNTFNALDKLDAAVTSYKKAIALKPQYAQAHSNLGDALRKLGKYKDAEQSCRQAITLEPENAQAHNNLGVTLEKLSRFLEAEASYAQAVILKPEYPEAHNNLSNALQALGRYNEAEASCRRALALKPDFSEAYSNLGNALQALGRVDEAVASYSQAITLKPAFSDALNNLGHALAQLGELDKAEASCAQAIAVKDNNAQAHFNRGTILKELGRLDEAEASYRQAIKLQPDYSAAHTNLGNVLLYLGKIIEAEGSFRQSIASDPHGIEAKEYLLTCFFWQDKKSDFFELLKLFISRGETSPAIGSMAYQAKFKFGDEVTNPFCKTPLKHVRHTQLSEHYHFENVFSKPVLSFIKATKFDGRAQGLLVNGSQTAGNLFSSGHKFIDEIERIIRLEIEKYRLHFEDSKEGFLTNWPSEYSLGGWLISMKSGGKLAPHIHEKGWLSGSIYINVPPKDTLNSGNLNVAEGSDSFGDNSILGKEETIDVKTGSLVLFPSSVTHYTTPFDSDQERIVLAFDVRKPQ